MDTLTTLDDLDAQIRAVDEEMRPYRDRLAALRDERKTLLDRLLSDPDVPDALLAEHAADHPTAHRRLEEILRAAHPAITGAAHWIPGDEHGMQRYDLGWQVGFNLGLDRDTDTEALTALAAAMVDLAGRFSPTPPQVGTYPGMAHASLLAADCGEYHSWEIWFDPTPGGRAVLIDRRSYRLGPEAEGTLPQVLAVASRVAWYTDRTTG